MRSRRRIAAQKMTQYVPEMQTTPEIANLWPRHSNWTFNNIADVIGGPTMQLRSTTRPYLHPTAIQSPAICRFRACSTESNVLRPVSWRFLHQFQPSTHQYALCNNISNINPWYLVQRRYREPNATVATHRQSSPISIVPPRSWPKIWVAKKEPGNVFSDEVLP